MFDRLTRTARDAVAASATEARRRGDRRIGTDHLLVAVLHDPDIAALLGVGVEEARALAHALDREALATIGIDVGDFAPDLASKGSNTPLGSGVRSVMPRAVAVATEEKTRSVETRHLLVALLERDEPDPAAALLTALKVDRALARAKAMAVK